MKVSVDTAFNIKEVFPKWKLKRQVKGKYVVFHSNRFIGENSYQSALKELMELSKTYKILLLPLAVTNDDYDILKKLYKDSNEIFILPSEQLTMEEIVSYLAFCDLYIGVSFHGAITAFCYGNPVVGLILCTIRKHVIYMINWVYQSSMFQMNRCFMMELNVLLRENKSN